MKITMDTWTRDIVEKADKRDKQISEDQLVADIANILAATMAVRARMTFNTPAGRKAFIERICEVAINFTED